MHVVFVVQEVNVVLVVNIEISRVLMMGFYQVFWKTQDSKSGTAASIELYLGKRSNLY